LWLDASDTSTITESGGSVSQWNDKSGNGRNVVQSTGANQPTTGTRTINGLNVLDFAGDFLIRTTATQLVDSSTGHFTAFAVWLADTVSGVGGIISQDVSSGTRMPQMLRRDTTNLQTVRIAGGIFIDAAGVTVVAATTYVAASQHRTANIEAWLGGSTNGPTNTTGTNGAIATNVYVGSASGGLQLLDGVIGEILVFNRNFVQSEMLAVGSYLAYKWNGQWVNQ
jgi:hypothetical protein